MSKSARPPRPSRPDPSQESCLLWLSLPASLPWIARYMATVGTKDYQISICLSNSGKELSVFLDQVDLQTEYAKHIRAIGSYGIRKHVRELAQSEYKQELLRMLCEKQSWIWAETLLLSPMERLAASTSKAHRELKETQEQLSA